MSFPPIVLFAYNKIEHTNKVIAQSKKDFDFR